MIKLTDAEFGVITKYIFDTCGIDLSGKRFLVESKISTGCFVRHIDSFADFWKRLDTGTEAGELQQWLVDMLTTNYSFFYREAEHFEFLEKLLLDKQLPIHRTQMDIWCAGCAKGQEAYSLAMLMEENRRKFLMKVPYRIVASDISKNAIEAAGIGKYSLADYVRLPEEWRTKYFHLLPRECEVKQVLRRCIEFRVENILEPKPQARRFDAVFCRNVMIYFNKQTCDKLLSVFYERLVPGGYLFLGHTEIFNHIAGFDYVMPAVYKKVEIGNDLQEN